MKLLIGIVIAVFLIVWMINKNAIKQLIVKFRGRTEEIANKDAMTPDGARDYYNNAIRERQDLYAMAERTYAEIAGKLEEREKERYMLQKEIIKIQNNINACLDRNDEDGARQWAIKQATTEQKINTLKNVISELTKSRDQQDTNRKAIQYELDSLKEEKERVLFQLEADQQVISLHEGMNTSASMNESDRMLEKVREGARLTRERASGAQLSYETSEKAQNQNLEQQSRERQADDILARIKQQRGQL